MPIVRIDSQSTHRIRGFPAEFAAFEIAVSQGPATKFAVSCEAAFLFAVSIGTGN